MKFLRKKINKWLPDTDLVAWILILGLIFLIIAPLIYLLYLYIVWTDSNVEFFLEYLKERKVEVPLWLSGIIAILGNLPVFICNIVFALWKL